MKKFKKIFAVLVTFAMVLGMSMTTFAANAKVTVKGAENANLTYIQAIRPNQTTPTGWEFTDSAIAEAYMNAFDVTDVQEAIVMLARYQDTIDNDGKVSYEDIERYNDVVAASSTQIDKALSNVSALTAAWLEANSTFTVSKAGIYVIKAVEKGYTYKTMAAYVGFGEVKNDDGTVTYPVLQDGEVNAKKSPTAIKKENEDDAADNAVAVGDTVKFKVTANFPYFDPNATDKSYVITDTLTGAIFDQSSVKITIGGKDYTRMVTPGFSEKDTKKIMEIDLSGLIDDGNSLANQLVEITYSATVTEVSVKNTVGHDVSDDTAETNIYTGDLTITKYAEDGKTTLEGAEFAVAGYFTVEDDIDDMGLGVKYATFDGNNVLTGWVDKIDDATHVTTGEDGKATVHGLDEGDYMFIEVKAPEGYSINEEPAGVTLVIDTEDGKANATFSAETDMKDTKLSSLPSTGGIGTTIFTIGGCAIMIIAAGLFFASRRKSAK